MLLAYSKEFGLTRVEFTLQALRHHAKSLRLQRSPTTKALGSEEAAEQFAAAQSQLARERWSQVSPEERKARMKKVMDARWTKKKAAKKKAAKKDEGTK